jgi:hypothetical protein
VNDDERADEFPEVAAQFDSLLKNALGTLEPSSVTAFGALLTLVQASNNASHPSQPHASEINNQAAQMAADALGQLSQPGPSNRLPLTSDTNPIAQVRSKCAYYRVHKDTPNIGPKFGAFCSHLRSTNIG